MWQARYDRVLIQDYKELKERPPFRNGPSGTVLSIHGEEITMTRIPMLTAIALVLGVTGMSLAELNGGGDGGARGEQQGSLAPAPVVSSESAPDPSDPMPYRVGSQSPPSDQHSSSLSAASSAL
jgi:hypothetical protein